MDPVSMEPHFEPGPYEVLMDQVRQLCGPPVMDQVRRHFLN